MQLSSIQAVVQSDLDSVNQLIEATLAPRLSQITDSTLSEELQSHIVKAGGKHLRPLLLLLSAKAMGYQGEEHLYHATAVEFFHTATLLHDDVIDESLVRRGLKTANQIWGSKLSILGGDDLYTKALKLIIGTGNLTVLELFVDCAHDIIAGEINQLAHKNQFDVDTLYYFDMIKAKTALLFKVSAEIGAKLSGGNIDHCQSLTKFGLHLGNAFQIVDDALDYTSDAMGKNQGDDLKDGKMTLPLIYARERADRQMKTLIDNSIQSGDIAHFSSIAKFISDSGALSDCYDVARTEIDKAQSELQVLENSPYKEALSALAQFSIRRLN